MLDLLAFALYFRLMTIDVNSNEQIITIFGGTGFIGRHIMRRLAKAGYTVKVATRVPESAYFLRPYGKVGQIVPFPCNYKDEQSIAAAVAGATGVINCIGILYQRRKNKFDAVHHRLAQTIARACRQAAVQRLIHISALGIDQSKSKYAASKRDGEASVRDAFPNATILRPSLVFGPEDEFFNKFARLSLLLPALPLIGGGKTKFQPVYVGDVADAAMAALTHSSVGADSPFGKTYELGGPEIVTFKEILQRLAIVTGRKRWLVPMPFAWAKLKATFIGLLPNPLLTRDQVESLKTDNVVNANALGFGALGLTPTAMSLILPDYLSAFRRPGLTATQEHEA